MHVEHITLLALLLLALVTIAQPLLGASFFVVAIAS